MGDEEELFFYDEALGLTVRITTLAKPASVEVTSDGYSWREMERVL